MGEYVVASTSMGLLFLNGTVGLFCFSEYSVVCQKVISHNETTSFRLLFLRQLKNKKGEHT